MPAKKPDKLLVTCPHCGHQQKEPREVISTVCKKCSQHLQVQGLAKPPAGKAPGRAPALRRITCFDCGAELEVAVSAQSTICKRCSSHIDLDDHRIAGAVSKNFKTKGAFVVELKGYVFNTEAIVGDAVIKGRFLGKLVAERSLTIYSTAEIKGSFTAGCLIIPADNHFRWAATITVGAAEIAGELAANLRAAGTIILKSTARLFGDLEARNLVVESGAVLVGAACVGNTAGVD